MLVKAAHQPYHLNYYNNIQKNHINSLKQNSSVPYSLEKEKTNHLNDDNYRSVFKKDAGTEAHIAEKRIVDRLRGRDAEVRAHEHAHIAAAGGVATSGPKYIYMRGPDGRLYAVGGEVSIDTSPVPGNPEKTIQKAQKLRRAALSPANPSGQDLRVAAAASRMEQQARAELAKEKEEEKAEDIKEQDIKEQDLKEQDLKEQDLKEQDLKGQDLMVHADQGLNEMKGSFSGLSGIRGIEETEAGINAETEAAGSTRNSEIGINILVHNEGNELRPDEEDDIQEDILKMDQKDQLRPGLRDIYSEKSAGISEESNQLINMLV